MQKTTLLKGLRYLMLEVDGKRYIIDKFTGKWSVLLGTFSMFLKKKVYHPNNYQALDSLIKPKRWIKVFLIFVFLLFIILLDETGTISLFPAIVAFSKHFNLAISTNTVTIINLSITLIDGLIFAFLLHREKQTLEKLIEIPVLENTSVYIPVKYKFNRPLFFDALKGMISSVLFLVVTLACTYVYPNLLCFVFYAFASFFAFCCSIMTDWRRLDDRYVLVDDYLE